MTLHRPNFMKKWSFLAVFVLASLIVFGFAGFNSNPDTAPLEMLPVSKGDPYSKQWKRVDSLENKGLTQSALEQVNLIYDKAKADNNPAQIVKSLIHISKYTQYVEEDAFFKNITRLQEEEKTAGYPLKPILQSILAETYKNYTSSNQWRIQNRTETADFENNDLRTWDLKTLTRKSLELYLASLESKDSLMRTPVHIYDDILHQGYQSNTYRPTLYDFLAHRAIDYLMNEQSYLPQPAYRFEVDGKEAFAPAATFARAEFETRDSLSFKYQALLIFQDLITLHLRDTAPDALVDVELKRLKFVRNNSIHPDKDNLYREALESLEKATLDHAASTWVSNELGNFWVSQGDKYVAGSADEAHRYDKVKALEIVVAGKKRFPQSMGAENCLALEERIRKTESLSLEVEKINVPDMPFRAHMGYKNLPKIWLRVVKLDDNHWAENRDMYGDKWYDFLMKQKPVQEWTQELPATNDYQSHSVEIKIPGLPVGTYVVLASTNEQFSKDREAVAYAYTYASNLSFATKRGPDGTQTYYVFDRTTGHPLQGVNADVWEQKYNYTLRKYTYKKNERYTTDANGSFVFKIKQDESRSFNIELTHKDDRLFTNDNFSVYGYYRNQTNQYTKTTFFTDRAIYRPGQTIYFKGIMLRYNGETPSILTNKSVRVELVDVNYQVVESLDLKTNEYGTFEGAFTAPQGVLTGQMQLRTPSGSQYFSVEEYKRPKFEVEFKPVAGSFKLGESVKVSGNAKAYAGSNIDGAQVKYRVTRQASFPWWWGWYRWGYPRSSAMEILHGDVITGENGDFEIEFTAIPDLSIPEDRLPQFRYTVYADVTDISGETRSASTGVNVGYVALNMNLRIPETVDKKGGHNYKIAATNLNGEPEPAKGQIRIFQLKTPQQFYRDRLWSRADQYVMSESEYHRNFPNDVYQDEDDFHSWEKGKEVYNQSFDTEKEDTLRLKKVKNWASGKYLVELETQDKFGKKVSLKKYFTLYEAEGNEMPLPEAFLFNAVKSTVEPGDKAAFMVGTSAIDAKALLEVEFKGEIIRSEWIALNNEKKRIEIPVEEKHRGNLGYYLTFVRNGRFHHRSQSIYVPWSNKQLKLEFETFRDKLQPGQEEEWRLKISGPKGDAVAAEMVAAMYDASLDAFRANSWSFSPWGSRYNTYSWNGNQAFTKVNASLFQRYWNQFSSFKNLTYDQLNWFGWYAWEAYNYYYRNGGEGAFFEDGEFEEMDMIMIEEEADGWGDDTGGAPPPPSPKAAGRTRAQGAGGKAMMDSSTAEFLPSLDKDQSEAEPKEKEEGEAQKALGEIKVRTNLNETAFFFPKLKTNEKGEVILAFTIPEALTRWKMMGLAHTTDLKTGQITKNTVTQKELMVMPNTPRFFRENDKMTFTAKVSNLAEGDLSGVAQLELLDAFTGKPVDANFKNDSPQQKFSVKKGQSARLAWNLTVPEDVQAVTVRVKAAAGNFTDGEENVLPVLTNRMLVTETMPLPVRENQTRTFTFDKLKNNQSTTLKHHRLTLEFTSNPAWYAIQALPYLMEYPYECNEQVFSRFYANSIASHVANSSPKIKTVFDSWKNETPEALLSNLEKNQELKALLLEETPWVLNAQNESARKRRVGLLFDLNRMANELDAAIAKLEKNQVSNGGWPWFKGGPDSRYITQHIVCGMGHLDHLGVKSIREDKRVWDMTRKAVLYCDDRIREDYDWLKKHATNMEEDHLGGTAIHYLYARTYFKDIPLNKRNQQAFDYYLGQADKYWLKKMRYYQAMISLALHREDQQATAMDIIKSLKENSIYNEELGRYWKANTGGYYWYEAPIETQAMFIEAFDEVANDKQSVGEMQVWLLKQKQTQDWRTTKATVEACYALLLRGTDFLAESEMAEITVGGKLLDISERDDVKVEAGTGYFKTAWAGSEITPEMGEVTVKNKNDVVAWGGMYWQYFEQLDKITPAETPLKLEKKLFLEKPGDTGPVITPITEKTTLKPGDKVKVRIELRVDRRMEYIHMKDMRAAGFEPINVISRYKYQDGLGYYEATRDAATNFFISAINPGTYVFEYPLRVTHAGNFSNGITTIQCMYAPEFASHSEGIRVEVK